MLSVKEKLHLIYVWEEEENAEDSPFYGVYGSARKEESKQQSRWYLIARVKKSNPRYNTIIEHLSRKYSHIKAVEVDSVLPEGFIDKMFPQLNHKYHLKKEDTKININKESVESIKRLVNEYGKAHMWDGFI